MSQAQLGVKSTGAVQPGVAVSNDAVVGVAAAVFFFVVVIFFAILYLYAKHVWAPNRLRRSRLVFASYDPASFPRIGLSSAVLESLPITVFRSGTDHLEEELECAVCLYELSEGEQVRMLPKCNHGFHLDCIDMWFQSHYTCPLCRSPVEINPVADGVPASEAIQNHRLSLTESSVDSSVKEEGTSSSVVSSSVKREGMLVIEIPSVALEGFWSTQVPTSERMKTPTSARRRSLTGLLSRGKRTVGSAAASPGEGDDIEQGLQGTAGESRRGITPRIPRNS